MGLLEFIAENAVVSGIVMLCISVTLFVVIRREDRLRPDAWWVNNDMTSIVHAPLITICGALGAGSLVHGLASLSAQPVSGQGWAVAAAAVIVAGLSWYLLGRDAGTSANVGRARAAVATN